MVITSEKEKEIRELGYPACRNVISGFNFHEIALCEGMDFNYYLMEAKAIVEQLQRVDADPSYMLEKMSHVIQLLALKAKNFRTPEQWKALEDLAMAVRRGKIDD